MWLVVEEEGQKDDLMITPVVVATSAEEVWQFAETHLKGKPLKDFLEPAMVRAEYVPTIAEYPTKNPPDSFDVAYEQSGHWVLAEH